MSGWNKPKGGANDPNSHTHTNKATLDKFGESNGQPLFNGSAIGGSGGGSYTLPVASSNVLGGVKVGSGLTINNGLLSATGGSTTSSAIGDFIIRDSANLLNPATITAGKTMNPTTGVISDNAAQSISDFIPVTAGLTYTTSKDYMLWAWYDANKTFVSGHYAAGGLNTGSGPAAGKQNDAPADVSYLRIAGTNEKMNSTIVFRGKYLDMPNIFESYDQYSFTPKMKIDKLLGQFEGKTMNVFGDSISMDGDGSGSPSRGDRWTGAFERELGFRITNFAIGGSRMTPEADGSDMFKSVYNVVYSGTDDKKTIDYQADYTVIFSGTNDHGKNMPLGTIADTTNATFYGAYKLVIQKLLTENIDLKLFLVTPIQKFMGHVFTDTGEGWFWNEANGNGDTLLDFVNAIKEIGRYYSIPVIDLHAKARINEFTKSLYFMSDMLHPNKDGHRVMADAMKKDMF